MERILVPLWSGILLSALAFNIEAFVPGTFFAASFNISYLGLLMCIMDMPGLLAAPSALVISTIYPEKTSMHIIENTDMIIYLLSVTILLRIFMKCR